MNNEQKHLKEILTDFDNAMLVTLGADGKPRSRPMRVADVTDANEVWFVTNRQSEKVDEIEANADVGITMQSGSKFVSLTGTAMPVANLVKIDELWSEAWKIWFPDGKRDPSILLLRIVPTEGEYWDISGTNRWRYLYQAGKAYFQGKELDHDALDGVNVKVDL